MLYSENDMVDKKRQSLQCKIFPLNTLGDYMFVVICTNYKGKWILSRHKSRETWETQGGHIEAGEEAIASAARELYEESGITDADIYPVCDYLGYDKDGSANGVSFLAVVREIGELPESEMKEIKIFEDLPKELTYPDVTPVLIAKAEELLKTI